jgi:hypothetical protein
VLVDSYRIGRTDTNVSNQDWALRDPLIRRFLRDLVYLCNYHSHTPSYAPPGLGIGTTTSTRPCLEHHHVWQPPRNRYCPNPVRCRNPVYVLAECLLGCSRPPISYPGRALALHARLPIVESSGLELLQDDRGHYPPLQETRRPGPSGADQLLHFRRIHVLLDYAHLSPG